MDKNLPVGVIDSGVGGLSVLKVLQQALPHEDFLYIGDTARTPYGQRPEKEIYGPAHNSILQVPGTDKWYIVYHRINKNYLKSDPGVHREVCIDRMEFNEDGSIKQVIPTR